MIAALVVLAAVPSGAAAQIYELPRPDTSDTKTFGVSVALSGDVAVVGASGEAVCGENAGAAYVFERSAAGGVWERVARLTPDECRPNAFFGENVDVDGGSIIVSASSEFFAFEKSNAAYVFERDSTGWTQSAKLTRTVGTNVQEGLYAADVAIDDDRAVVTTAGDVDGAYGGAVYVYDYDAEADLWRRSARLTADSGVARGVLGGTVDLDGDRIAVAASTYFKREPGSVYVFQRDSTSGAWSQAGRIGNVREFFISLDLDGRTLLVGESRAGDDQSGRVTVHREMRPGAWERVATLRPSTPYEGGAFGSTVSLRGDWALVTGYDEQLGQDFNIDRVVYAFREREGTWEQRTIIDIGKVAFGADIDQDTGEDGQTALISSVPETEDGAAYVVKLH